MNSISTTILFSCLLMGGSVWAMNPQDNQQGNQEQTTPGRFNEVLCLMCRDDFREFSAERSPVVLPCGHWVCSNCCAQINRCPYCRLAIAAGANVDVANLEDITPLYSAAVLGHTETVRALIAAGANVNAADRGGSTPIYWAAIGGHIEIVRALIAAGANVSAADSGGHTALYWAVLLGHTEMVRALIAAGANVNAATHRGDTPLSIAENNSRGEVAAVLRQAGATTEL